MPTQELIKDFFIALYDDEMEAAILLDAMKELATIPYGKENKYPIHEAVVRCSPLFIERLVELGADVNSRDITNRTPLHLWTDRKAGEKWEKIGHFLLQNGADINAQDEFGRTPIHCASVRSYKATKFLVNNGANVNAQDDTEFTPLHLATRRENLNSLNILLLLRGGADWKIAYSEGLTPLEFAQGWNNTNKENIKVLEEWEKNNPDGLKGRSEMIKDAKISTKTIIV